MSNNFLTQAVDEPTRLKNYLDLVLCSDPSLIDNVSVEEPFETSDHQIVTFNIAAKNRVCKHNKQFYNNPVAPWIGVGWCRRDGMSLKLHHLTTESMMSTKGLIIHGVAG